MTDVTATADRNDAIEALRVYANAFGIDADGGGAEAVVKKCLVMSANRVDLQIAYPIVGDDLEKIAYRGGSSAIARYRGLASNAFMSIGAIKAVFESVDTRMLDAAPAKGDLAAYAHFKANASALLAKVAPEEWKKLLAFYLPAIDMRGEQAIANQLLGRVRVASLRAFIAENMTEKEYAEGVAHAIKAAHFRIADSHDVVMVLRDPTRVSRSISNSLEQRRAQMEGNADAEIPLWERPETYKEQSKEHIALVYSDNPAHKRVQKVAPIPLTFKGEKAYRNLPPVKEALACLLETGQHTPPLEAYRAYVQAALESGPHQVAPHDSHERIHDASLQQVLSLMKHMPVADAIDTTEMQDFLHTMASHLTNEAFSSWTDLNSLQRLVTVHCSDWMNKWDSSWRLDEGVMRGVMAHRSKYERPSAAFVHTVLGMEPVDE